MCMHILFCVCIVFLQRKKAREVYALHFVRTSSYATVGVTGYLMARYRHMIMGLCVK